jgi:hypothetical protein
MEVHQSRGRWHHIENATLEIIDPDCARIGPFVGCDTLIVGNHALTSQSKLSNAICHYVAESLKNTENIRDDSGFIRSRVPILEHGIDTIQREQSLARFGEFLEWLSPTNHLAQQSDLIARRQEETGKWFLDSREFTDWLQTPSGTLFCPGVPGAGKSMIAAIAVNHLFTNKRSPAISAACLYINYKQHSRWTANSFLRAILRQVVQPNEIAVIELAQSFAIHKSFGTDPTFQEVLDALQIAMKRLSTTYLVIDALDECPDHDGTRQQLCRVVRQVQGVADFRLMATSRFVPDVVRAFDYALTLEVRATEEDVKRYVGGQLHRLARCVQRDPELQNLVQSKIVDAVQGM